MIVSKWTQFKRFLVTQKEAWIKKRTPIDNIIQLNINNTFILPSSFGWACIGIIISLFILGTNLQNNIILLLCYFLLAMVLLAVLHSYFFFVQHQIYFLPIEADYENRQMFLPLRIHSRQDYLGGSIEFSIEQKQIICQPDSEKTFCKVPLPTYTRGYYQCPSVTMSAYYGFGLFKCWTNLLPHLSFHVFPSVQKSSIQLYSANSDAQLNHASDSQIAISDDLQGIREYQSTDPMHHVSWKHVAKGQGMLTKDFNENKGVSGWLRLIDLQHLGTENALRCLCYQVQQLDKEQVQFGLDLGHTKILPKEGSIHLKECLIQLAMYADYEPSLGKSSA